jgi:hypothetical protein
VIFTPALASPSVYPTLAGGESSSRITLEFTNSRIEFSGAASFAFFFSAKGAGVGPRRWPNSNTIHLSEFQE